MKYAICIYAQFLNTQFVNIFIKIDLNYTQKAYIIALKVTQNA
nr:MAG TPA: hypothetical protein [Caudoviricetes sp.]